MEASELVAKSIYVMIARIDIRSSTALPMVFGALLVGGSLTSAHEAFAQTYPSKSIRHIIPYAPGGALDIIARIMAPRLAERVGQQVIVDNRPGAGSMIGSEMLVRASADGYTIMTANIAHGANPYLHKKMPYDTTKDFAPVALIALLPNLLLTHPSVPAQSAKDLIALAKAHPGQLTYASAGNGSTNHLTMALFADVTKIDVVHVPYKGGGPAVVDLVAGHVKIAFVTIPPTLSYVKDGRLRALGISGARRSVTMPDTPTLIEAGISDFDVSDWHGVLAPAGVPRTVIERLNKEINAILLEPEVRSRIEGLGAEVSGGPPERLQDLIQGQLALWGKVIVKAGIRVE